MISSNNLREIHMNDSDLYVGYIQEKEEVSDLDPAYNNRFIFHYCCKTLERVSIRNAKWYHDNTSEPTIVSQNALIKFVRSVPSLRWF
jgi:hypothetical protein